MSITGILLGLINICIVVAILLLVGLLIEIVLNLILRMMGSSMPAQIRTLYLIIVALVALYMLVSLLLGHPTWKVVQHQSAPIGGMIAPAPNIITEGRRR